MYKNMSGYIKIDILVFFSQKKNFFLAVLTNLEKINSLPMEIQTMSNKQEMNINRQTGFDSEL
jgi:hypothetical protein